MTLLRNISRHTTIFQRHCPAYQWFFRGMLFLCVCFAIDVDAAIFSINFDNLSGPTTINSPVIINQPFAKDGNGNPFGSITVRGVLASSPDPDFGPNPGKVLANAPYVNVVPTGSFGSAGEISIVGGMLLSVDYDPGSSPGGDSAFPGGSGFRGYTYSASGAARNPKQPGKILSDPTTLFPLERKTLTQIGGTTPSAYFNSFRFTTGGPSSDVLTWSRGGQAQVDNVSLTFESVDSILRNPNTLKVDPQGPEMNAVFQPHGALGPIDIRDLARALDVDHFNWKQEIIGLPSKWISGDNSFVKLENLSDPSKFDRTSPIPRLIDGTPVSSEIVTVPFLDPVPSGQDAYGLFIDGEWHIASTAVKADDFPYYFHETSIQPGWKWSDHVATDANGIQSLTFVDAPSGGTDWFTGPFPYLMFSTRLVGVKKNGTELPLGIGFNWKTNAVNATNSFQFASFLYENPSPIVSGGVFDVQVITPVPEIPTASFCLTVSLVGFAFTRRQAHRKLTSFIR